MEKYFILGTTPSYNNEIFGLFTKLYGNILFNSVLKDIANFLSEDGNIKYESLKYKVKYFLEVSVLNQNGKLIILPSLIIGFKFISVKEAKIFIINIPSK